MLLDITASYNARVVTSAGFHVTSLVYEVRAFLQAGDGERVQVRA